MAELTLQAVDREGNIIASCSGEDFVDLVCKHHFQEGDRIHLAS